MEFKEVSPTQFSNFALNSNLAIYGVSEDFVHREYISEHGRSVCVGIRLLVGNQNCLVREDYIQYCNLGDKNND